VDMFLYSNAVSLGFVATSCALARSRFGGRGVFCLSAVLFFASGACQCYALAAHAAVTALATVACLPFRPKPKVVMFASVAAMLVSYGALFLVEPSLQKVWRFRQEYPFHSISDRLAYEERGVTKPAVLAPQIEQRLARAEEADSQSWGRSQFLELLHSRTVGDFVLADGFGEERMGDFPRDDYFHLPPSLPNPVVQPATELIYDPAPDSAFDIADQVGTEVPILLQAPLLKMHEAGILDFVNQDSIGFARDRNHVAGFRSHRFTETPRLVFPKGQQTASWRLARLELVSLLKHEAPVAYISKNLPKMDELRDAPTRPLDSFEQQAIDQIRSDADFMIDDTADRIRMVGSLRASKTCLKCHSVQRGALLGALTYELVPARPTHKKTAQVNPPSS